MTNTVCELPNYNPPSDEIIDILQKSRKIAIVGISKKESRDSNKIARYLLEQGYEITPVNTGQREILGRPCFKTIDHLPFAVDMVNLFIEPKRMPKVVDQAIDMQIPVIWTQIGVTHNESAQKARDAGIKVVMNMCIMQEHMKMTKL